MRIMARLRRCLFVAFSLIGLSHQEDPIVDFCRRWGHQTAQVNGRLYIDGGMVDWATGGSNDTIFSDLNSSTPFGMPYQYANLSKPSEVPNVSGGILWSDEINKCFYQFGGAFTNGTPSAFSMWTYDVLDNRWQQTKTKPGGGATQRVAYGAGTHIDDLGLGFYFGGYASNQTDPNWTGSPVATSDLVRFEYSTGFLSNNSGPEDNVGRAEGQMVYLPISDSGLLIYFGGIEDPQQNGTSVPANMSEIHMYDVQSSKWYTQTATGNIPGPRRQFCAGVTWAEDQSSYNIYLYGGYGFGNPLAYDDVYILSLPSYTWIKAFPTDNSTSKLYSHGGCSANVVGRDQMIIIGGWFPESNVCDSREVQGQHNMNLGYNGEKKAIWDKYDPDQSSYSVPTPIIAAIGGGPTGAATKTAPASWDNPDLAVYYTLQAPSVTRTATRTLPSSTGTPSEGSSKSRVGAIVGGVLGGLAVLIIILCLILCCLRRKKKSKKEEEVVTVDLPPPVELGVTTAPQELPAHGVGKYMPVHQQEQYSPYSGAPSLHSPHSTYAQQSSVSGSPPHVTPYGSPHDNNYPQLAYPQNTHARSPSWETAQVSSMDTRYSHQGQHSPMTSSLPSYAPPQEVLYYPPPREAAYQSPMVSPASYGYDTGQYHDGGSSPLSPPPASTMPTPTQFYARPAPVPGDTETGYVYPPTEYGNYGESLEPQRRPKYGRFVEVNHT